jgi:hypothetical protein
MSLPRIYIWRRPDTDEAFWRWQLDRNDRGYTEWPVVSGVEYSNLADVHDSLRETFGAYEPVYAVDPECAEETQQRAREREAHTRWLKAQVAGRARIEVKNK